MENMFFNDKLRFSPLIYFMQIFLQYFAYQSFFACQSYFCKLELFCTSELFSVRLDQLRAVAVELLLALVDFVALIDGILKGADSAGHVVRDDPVEGSHEHIFPGEVFCFCPQLTHYPIHT